ncbi:MAG: dihydrodipicolinate synthase family protein [Eubacteriales bacterium]|nr:dihydrodipicolinate synthase family protein [Eubacteriales bacterium]
MNLEKYCGVIPAFYACYDDQGEVSVERTKAFAEYLVNKGVKGLYLTGSSGECIYQNVEERKLVMKAVAEAVKGKTTLIAHVAANNTRDSVELARYAGELGMDAIAAIPPIYFRLPEKAIEEYWTAMLEAAGIDFFIYNIPQTTGYTLSVDLFKKMMAKPGVVGVKNSSMPVEDIIKFKLGSDKKAIVFNGPDEQYLAGRMVGADGGIGGTYGVMPELFLQVDKFIEEKRMEEAAALQQDITAIIYQLCSCQGGLYSVIKELLRRDGMNIGQVREPLPRIVESDKENIDKCEKMIADAKVKYCK